MSVVEIVDHPLIQHKISLLRDRNTGTKEFRDLVSGSRCCSAMRLPATCPPRKSRSRPPWLWPAPRSWPAVSWLWSPSCAPASAWWTAC